MNQERRSREGMRTRRHLFGTVVKDTYFLFVVCWQYLTYHPQVFEFELGGAAEDSMSRQHVVVGELLWIMARSCCGHADRHRDCMQYRCQRVDMFHPLACDVPQDGNSREAAATNSRDPPVARSKFVPYTAPQYWL